MRTGARIQDLEAHARSRTRTPSPSQARGLARGQGGLGTLHKAISRHLPTWATLRHLAPRGPLPPLPSWPAAPRSLLQPSAALSRRAPLLARLPPSKPSRLAPHRALPGGQETLVVFDDVFIPYEHVFMDGEYEFAQEMVARFTAYHRASYVCKTGLGDVMVGAAAAIAEYNGADGASHIKDKLVEMTHLNETIYSSGIASSHEAKQMPSGIWMNDAMLANVCKHNVTRFPYEISRLAQDLAGGIMVTLPSEADFRNEVTGPMLEKYLKGRSNLPVEVRQRMLRLIENMTLGRNAVGYLTESMHGAGSPQAQRIQILRGMEVDRKKALAEDLAGVQIDRNEG